MNDHRDEGKPGRKRRSRRRRFARLLVYLTVLLIGALSGLWIWLESPAGQERARRWLEARSSALLQREVSIQSLDFDLVPFRARLSGLEIAGAPGSDQSLLRIDSAQVRVWPWALLARELRLQSIEIESPVVHWDTGSGSNLALETRSSGLAVNVERLVVADGVVEINHQRWNLDSSLDGVSLQLEPVAQLGSAARQRSGVLRVGGGDIRLEAALIDAPNATPGAIELVEAEVPFLLDESRLVIQPARVELGNSELTASGAIAEWSSAQLTIGGRIEVRDLVGLSGIALAENDAGVVTLDGQLTWGNEPLSFTGALSSPSLTLAGIEGTGLSADVEASASQVLVENARLSVFGGTVAARIAADLAAQPRAWTLQYDLRDVDLNALSGSPALPGFRFAGLASASGDLTWRAPLADTITGAGVIDLTLPGTTLEILSRPDTGAAEELAPPAAGETGTPEEAGQRGPRQTIAPSLPLPLTAHADFGLDRGSLAVRDATAFLPGNEASFRGSIDRDGSIVASVSLDSTDLRLLDRFFNQIRRFRGEQPVPRPFGLDGSGRIVATIGGSVDDPTLDGTVEARRLEIAGNRVGDIDGDLRLVEGSLEIVELNVQRLGGTGQGEGRLRIGQQLGSGPDYSFGLRLQDFPIEFDLPRLGAPLAASADTSGEISLSGFYNAPPVGLVTLVADNVQLNNLGSLRADVQVRLETDQWIAERFEISGPRGLITISGSWLRAEDTVQAQLDAINVEASIVNDLIEAELPLTGMLEAQALLTGPFSAPDAAATLRWTEAGAYGVTLGAVAMSTELRGGAIAVSAVGRSDPTAPAVPPPTPTAAGGAIAIPLDTVPPGGWAATLSADLAQPHRATVRAVGASDLAVALLAAQGLDIGEEIDVSGSVEAEATGILGQWSDWDAEATLSDFVWTRPDLTFSIPQPLRLEAGAGLLRVDLPELISEAGSLQASGIIDLASGRWVEARSTGLVSLGVLGALSEELEAGGTLEVDVEASGEVLAGDVAGSFELYDVAISHARSPWSVSQLNGTVLLSDNTLDLRDVSGLVNDRPVDIDGTLPLAALSGDTSAEPFTIEATIDALPLAPLWQRAGPLSDLISGGEAAVTATLRGRGGNWRDYEGRVDVRSLRIGFTDLDLTMPTPATLTIAGDRIEVTEPIVLQGPATNLQVSGAFLIAPFRLDTRLQGTAALDPLNRVTGEWGLAGLAELDVRVSGNPPDLAYDGTMQMTSGLLNAPVLQPVENISADLVLQSRRVRIERLVGTLGAAMTTDTNVSARGEIQLVDSVPQRFVLNLEVDEAELRIQRGTRVTATADLVHEGTLERSVLSGRVSVSQGEYTRRWESEEAMMSLSDTGFAGVDHPLAQTVVLDVDVVAPGELRIVNNVADVELSADLQIRGTLANPVILGSATVLDGSVTYRDQRYRFLRGVLDFQNPLRTEPSFDIALETSIRQYLVTLNASGSPVRGDITATFVSSPPLSDLQLIQLLTVGSAPEEDTGSGDETLSALGTQAASFLTRQYLSQVERGAQRVFGIDRLDVQPAVTSGSGDPTARVTLGKQVTPDLWVSYTTVLGTTDEQLVTLEYQLTRGIQLRAQREDDGSFGIDVRFDHRLR